MTWAGKQEKRRRIRACFRGDPSRTGRILSAAEARRGRDGRSRLRICWSSLSKCSGLLLAGFLCCCPASLLSSSDACLTFRTQCALRYGLSRRRDLFRAAWTTLGCIGLRGDVRRSCHLLWTARTTLDCGRLGGAIEKSTSLLKLRDFSVDSGENLVGVHLVSLDVPCELQQNHSSSANNAMSAHLEGDAAFTAAAFPGLLVSTGNGQMRMYRRISF